MRLKTEVKEWFSHKQPFPKSGRVHFVGIGGAGMSALARILLHQGREVSGSDSFESRVTQDLRERGAKISIGQSSANVKGAIAIVFSDAIDMRENTEAQAARDFGVLSFRRSQLLGEIVNGKRLIAITGTHGKTTTTTMLSSILADAGLDPLTIVGADVLGFDGNVRFGKGEFTVVEACEAYDSFHDLEPEIVILTNLEPDHMDYHKSWENLRDSVVKFVRSAKGSTPFIYCGEDAGACEIHKIVGTGVSYCKNDAEKVSPKLPGIHNRLNAAGAVKVSELIGVDIERAIESVSNALAPERRLEIKGERSGITLVDDYAHHPTEIRASIEGLRERYSNRRLIVVFQPHLYSRTRDLLSEFAEALALSDIVILTDIYPAREDPIPGVSSAVIAEQLEQLGTIVQYIPVRYLLARSVAEIAKPGDVVVGMGAGNIDTFVTDFLGELKWKDEPLHIGAFSGGESAEREVSLLSGKMISDALRKRGYKVSEWDPSEFLFGSARIDGLKDCNRPDIIFLALHGTGGEDGRVQGFLELMHMPFVGSGLYASAMCMDKAETKRILESHGIRVPFGAVIERGGPIPDLPFPLVVKPNEQGSTIGLGFASEQAQLVKCLETAFKYDDRVVVEEHIFGIEISVPVVGNEPMPAVEIKPLSGTYDFVAKYTPGATEEIVPAGISDIEEREARSIALQCHKILQCEDYSRTDMIVTKNGIVVLEVNTLPGMTATSLLPKSAQASGIEYDELCDKILILAINRYGITKKKN